jgi:hypothetical protein
LVLEFSKGQTQAGALASSNFEGVPFKGARTEVHKILHAIGLVRKEDDIGKLISNRDHLYGYQRRACGRGRRRCPAGHGRGDGRRQRRAARPARPALAVLTAAARNALKEEFILSQWRQDASVAEAAGALAEAQRTSLEKTGWDIEAPHQPHADNHGGLQRRR